MGKGASALCCNESVSEEQYAQVRALFDAVGVTTLVDESAMNGITAVSGSGPAYLFSFVEALIDGGVKMDCPRHRPHHGDPDGAGRRRDACANR
ncbi:MAG: hypothetical protein JKP90_23090 [Desulfofustis sp. PB-SRB1]|nr:hypothetical protein [Desulfofustis sp. PB-SRB1]